MTGRGYDNRNMKTERPCYGLGTSPWSRIPGTYPRHPVVTDTERSLPNFAIVTSWLFTLRAGLVVAFLPSQLREQRSEVSIADLSATTSTIEHRM